MAKGEKAEKTAAVQIEGKVKNVSSSRSPGKDGGVPIIVTRVVFESVSLDASVVAQLVECQHDEADIRAKLVPLQAKLPLAHAAQD